ncbi:MAG: hypothetical protein QOI80_1568 [Solirubrobacteraceae bacterium]|jgi:hypothetical protein|nr:hypothetical protein [Solirubrobacteraceae bacterium]
MPWDAIAIAAAPALDRRTLAAALVTGLAALVALRLWQGEDYWTYSEGVYALTARLFLHGADLYGTTAAAQPPGVFVVGAGILALHDSLEFLRLCIGLIQLGGGMIAAVVAWRLSGSRAAAVAAPALLLLTPWAVHEHGSLTPEPVAVPLLLGGALLVSRPATAAPGGALAALAIGFKLPFLAPAIGIVACASDRRRAALGAGGALVVMVGAGLAVFGSGLVRDVITAQLRGGRHALGALPGFVAQAGWNLAGLLPAALLLVRTRTRDPALARAWLGLTVGLLATLLTIAKLGTALNILVPVEAALAPVALAVAVRWRRLGAVALAFVLVQTVALVAFPARTIFPFVRPLSERGAWGRQADAAQVRRLAAAARACPPGIAYSGEPFVAFMAHRRPPGGQPDLFLVPRSPVLARERRAVAADRERCP